MVSPASLTRLDIFVNHIYKTICGHPVPHETTGGIVKPLSRFTAAAVLAGFVIAGSAGCVGSSPIDSGTVTAHDLSGDGKTCTLTLKSGAGFGTRTVDLPLTPVKYKPNGLIRDPGDNIRQAKQICSVVVNGDSTYTASEHSVSVTAYYTVTVTALPYPQDPKTGCVLGRHYGGGLVDANHRGNPLDCATAKGNPRARYSDLYTVDGITFKSKLR
jgi:hypothetical protein